MGCSHSNTDDFVWKSRKESRNPKISKQSDIKFNLSSIVKGRTESIAKYYKLIKKIGSGTFGMVYKVKHLQTGFYRAMKVVKKDTINYQDDNHEFLKEIEILSILDHPNIIKIYEYYVDEINYYVVSELARGGELYEQIYTLKNYSEKNTALIMNQLFSAVNYIHSKGIVHRDLKPENILLETKDRKDLFIKLIDFGTANYIKEGQLLYLKVGTPYYIAPEVIKKSYDKKCDIWSLGVIMFMLLSGNPPFDGANDMEIMNKVLKGEYSLKTKEWELISNEAKDLIAKLLTFNPKNRITAEVAKNHPWIAMHTQNTHEVNEIDKTKFKKHFENLRKFSAKQKLQQTTIAYLVRQIASSDIVKELRKIFQELDTDGGGTLSFDEIKRGFVKYYGEKIGETEWSEIIKNLDQDGNNEIEYEEFIRCTVNLEDILTENNLKISFDSYDTDGSGFLDIKEIKVALGVLDKDNVSSDLIKDILNQIDNNSDGQISFEEFKQLMMKVLKT